MMRKRLGILLALAAGFAVAAAPAAANKDQVELRKSVPFTIRGGLPNFYAKLNAKKDVVICYFGGSITAGNGWRTQSAAWLQKEFPNSKVREINASIGGTNSTLGAYRMGYDVLRHKPDLVFVEFATNDHASKPEPLRKAMEGIVRQIWQAYPECDICFVYTITKDSLKSYQDGKFTRAASVMEDIADYYDIPSINLGYEVAALATAGKLIIAGKKDGVNKVAGDGLDGKSDGPGAGGAIVFSGDGVHPHADTGHKLYTDMVKKAMPEFAKSTATGAHALKPAQEADCIQKVTALSPGAPQIKRTGGVKLNPAEGVAKAFALRSPEMWQLKPGDSLEFKFKGTRAAMYDVLGPDSGRIDITVDGKTRSANRFDSYCTWRRLGLCGLAGDLEDAVHTVKITVSSEPIDKRKILSAKNREIFDKKPADYEKADFFAGTIFLIGEVVE